MTQDPLVGTTVAGFRITEMLGRGGMGEVYLAHEESLGRRVVLKFLARRLAGEPDLVHRFAREARAAARLNHPNVVTIYSVHEIEGRPFYAMEYVEGESLAQLILRKEQIEIRRALAIAAQVADALACAHEAGILHRDIKPSNILIASTGVVKVLDFGIAKILGEKTELTTDGSFLGTVAYASPEQCESRQLDGRTDVYSFGIVLYEMLAGRPPYVGDTPLTIIRRIATEPPPDLDNFNPAVPLAVKRLIGRMIEKDRDLRMPDGKAAASEIRRLLRELGEDSGDIQALAAGDAEKTLLIGDAATRRFEKEIGVPLGRPVSTSEITRPRRRRRILWATGGFVLLVILIAALQGPENRRARAARRSGDAAPRPTATPARTIAAPTPAPTPAYATPQPRPTIIAPTPTPRATEAARTTPPILPGASTPRAWPTPAVATPTPAPTRPPRPSPFTAQSVLQAVPANRDLVMWFDVRALLGTPLIQSNESKVFSAEAIRNLNVFFGHFGVDWRRDVDHLVLAGNANRPETLMAMFHGRWNESFIIDQLKKDPTYKEFEHGGRAIHAVVNPEHRRLDCTVFLRHDIAVCGILRTVQEVCETAADHIPSILTKPSLRNTIETVRGGEYFWIMGAPTLQPGNPALNNLDAWILKGRFVPDLLLEGTAWPRNRADIDKAYKALRFIVEVWRTNKQDAELRRLGQNISLTHGVGTLTVTVRIPYYDAVRLLDRAAAQGNHPFR